MGWKYTSHNTLKVKLRNVNTMSQPAGGAKKASYQPKSFKEELRHLDIHLQKRIRWTLRLAGAWAGIVLFGAGAFLYYKPVLDKRREERIAAIKRGESLDDNIIFNPMKDAEKPIRKLPGPDSSFVSPPGYILDVIEEIIEDEKQKGNYVEPMDSGATGETDMMAKIKRMAASHVSLD